MPLPPSPIGDLLVAACPPPRYVLASLRTAQKLIRTELSKPDVLEELEPDSRQQIN